MKENIMSALILLLFILSGCTQTQPTKNTSQLVTVNLLQDNHSKNFIFLNKDIEDQFTAGVGIFKNTIYFTLLKGKYILVANGNGGQYYAHAVKGLKMKNMGLTEYRVGGFKRPNSQSGKWMLWSAPNYIASIAGVLVSTGATESNFVERMSVKDLSSHLNK